MKDAIDGGGDVILLLYSIGVSPGLEVDVESGGVGMSCIRKVRKAEGQHRR
jgi:hypothetical protein